jgi:hypothetical protein
MPKNSRHLPSARNEGVGLRANGSSGRWDVAIDVTTTGPDRWFLQIDGPSVSFYFEIPSLDVVGRMAHLLTSRDGNGSLVVSKGKDVPVTLVKDDEYRDRFFLIVGPSASPTVRFTLSGSDAEMVADALRQVGEDIGDE